MKVTKGQIKPLLKSSVDEPYFWIMTVHHSGEDTLRFVDNTEEIKYGGHTYMPAEFDVKLFTQDSQTMPSTHITIGILDEKVMGLMRRIRGSRKDTTIELSYIKGWSNFTRVYGPHITKFEKMTTDGQTLATIETSLMPAALGDSYPRGRFTNAIMVEK